MAGFCSDDSSFNPFSCQAQITNYVKQFMAGAFIFKLKIQVVQNTLLLFDLNMFMIKQVS